MASVESPIVKVRTLTGKVLAIPFSASMTVEELKLAIQKVDGIPPDQQRLIYAGKQLDDGRMLTDYKVEANSEIHLVLRLRGNGHPPPLVEVRCCDEFPKPNSHFILKLKNLPPSATPKEDQLPELMVVRLNSDSDPLPGSYTTSHESGTHLIRFVPSDGSISYGSTINIHVDTSTLSMGGSTRDDYKFVIPEAFSVRFKVDFTGPSAKPSCELSQLRNGPDLLSELRSSIATVACVNPHDIVQISYVEALFEWDTQVSESKDVEQLMHQGQIFEGEPVHLKVELKQQQAS